MDYEVVGKPIPRMDALEKATGGAVYGVDVKLPGLLHAKILRSPLPHARILNIDTSRAQRLLGVKAVVTGQDFPVTYGSALQDQPVLAIDRVRYVGEGVAAVAAVDEDVAEEALSLIRVEYEKLPAVFDPREAMQEGAVLVHPDLHTYPKDTITRPLPGTNVCHYFTLRHGDVNEGFAQADLIFEDTFTSQMVQHCSLEPNVAVAQVDATGKITLWSSTQAPYVVRRELADSMGMPMTHIRVICPWVGGGFGAKISPRADSRAVALALRTNHRPVRLAYSREEEFTSAAVRHPAILRHKTGVKRDGRIVAREIEVIWDTGAYAETGPTVSRNSGYTAPGPYNIPHVKIDGYCVYTNKVIAAAFRGYGVSQLTWAYESQMDIMARKLGIDPLEMRLRNAFEEGGVTATGEVLRVVGLKKTIYAAARSLDWDKPRTEGNKLRGKGIACMHKATRAPSDSSAFVKVNEDGTVAVLTSAVEAGQGVRTVLAQITGEVLGIKADAVAVTFADTDVTPFDPTTSSSRTTFHMGNAVKTAATDAREQLVQIASQAMEANPEDIEFRGGRVFVRGAPERGMTIAQVMRRRFGSRGGPILGKGTFAPSEATPLDLETSQGAKPTAYWMYATQGAEVEVDTDTGQVRVLKLVAAHDVGRAINPVNCQQQIQGALVMGLGGALTEEVVVQEGKALNTSLADYKVLTAMDAPVLEPIIVETPHYEGPFGAVGLGEPGLAPTAAAIANAVEDAIGVRIKDLPITPGRVLRALREKQGRQG